MTYTVTVTRVNEGPHQDAEVTVHNATSAEVSADGNVAIAAEDGNGRTFGATTWGSVTIVRVPGR